MEVDIELQVPTTSNVPRGATFICAMTKSNSSIISTHDLATTSTFKKKGILEDINLPKAKNIIHLVSLFKP